MKKAYMHGCAVTFLLACVAVKLLEGATGPSPLPVTITIEGLGVDTSPPLRIQSDQLGPYMNTKSVQSIIEDIGASVLDTNYARTSTRSVLVDFREPIPGSGPGGGNPVAPFAFQQVKARLIAKCNLYGVSMLNMYGVGSNIVCPLAVSFDYGGNTYRIAMNPDNYSETQPANITCMRVLDATNPATSQCNQWKIEPLAVQPDGQKKNVAKLLKVATNSHQTDQNDGDFYMSFAIDVMNP